MENDYNQAIARHYSAYRPPLHPIILSRVLSNNERFDIGLDIGCGSGYSAVALAKYCRQTYGLDPSRAMLSQTQPHSWVSYLQAASTHLPIANRSVEIVTFAGSLYYAKSNRLIQELKRICLAEAQVMPYDFEVSLEHALSCFGIKDEKTTSGYDHTINFSDSVGFKELVSGNEQILLTVSASELAHLLLASGQHLKAFVEKYGVQDPFPMLIDTLSKKRRNHELAVNITYTKYQLGDHPPTPL